MSDHQFSQVDQGPRVGMCSKGKCQCGCAGCGCQSNSKKPLFPILLFLSSAFSVLAFSIAGVNYYQQYLHHHLLETYVEIPQAAVTEIQNLLTQDQLQLKIMQDRLDAQDQKLENLAQSSLKARAQWLAFSVQLTKTFSLVYLQQDKAAALSLMTHLTETYASLAPKNLAMALAAFHQSTANLPGLEQARALAVLSGLNQNLGRLKVFVPVQDKTLPVQTTQVSTATVSAGWRDALRQWVVVRPRTPEGESSDVLNARFKIEDLQNTAMNELRNDLLMAWVSAQNARQSEYQVALANFKSALLRLSVADANQQTVLQNLSLLETLKVGYSVEELKPVQAAFEQAEDVLNGLYGNKGTV